MARLDNWRIAKHAFAANILVLSLVLSFAVPVAADAYQDLLDTTAANDRRDYATALRLYRLVADHGYIHAEEAQERLGFMCHTLRP
jgi:TPR repeat protein